ncbi:hypothetical protein [Pseudoduganella rhizocola]|uniref:hypothetical protein n=1 Tax=Pseudoduganella rhizocola TaxID=3382643 RepID=UPI0038B64E92
MRHTIISTLLTLSAIMDVANARQEIGISESTLQGQWYGGDTASEAIYGLMEISGNRISWGYGKKRKPACSTTFVVEKERAGSSFKDIRDHTTIIDAKNSARSYLLVLAQARCVKAQKLRLTFSQESEPDYLEMIEYDPDVSGMMHFHRK